MNDLIAEIEEVVRLHGADRRVASLELRSREDRYSDVRLLFADRSWLESAAGEQLVAGLQGHPGVASAQRRKSAISLRLTDELIAELGTRLAAGEESGPVAAAILGGERRMIGFVGPNTNKALHVGHLRNILLGQALACALEAAGAQVLRQSLVGDIGRRVCEAIAGFDTLHPGEDPARTGLKPDHFVNLCYRDYLGQREAAAGEAAGEAADANAEERVVRGDRADRVMADWQRGDPPVLRSWWRLRAWALEGHRQTLERLGVRLDRCDFESGGMHGALAMIEEGLAQGVLERGRGGAVLFKTGRPEYETMVLLREDGFPTEHARLLAAYDRLLDDLAPGRVYVEIAGTEWRASAMALRELLSRLRPGPRNALHQRVFHALLTTADEEKVSSSAGDPVLIDSLLARVEADERVARLAELAGGAATRQEIGDLVVRGYFLSAPAGKPLAFSWERFLEPRQNAGWLLAEAWCTARAGADAGGAPPLSPGYRLAVVQAQAFRQALRHAVRQLDVGPLARLLRSTCEVYLQSPSAGARMAAPVLGKLLRSLGFLAGMR